MPRRPWLVTQAGFSGRIASRLDPRWPFATSRSWRACRFSQNRSVVPKNLANRRPKDSDSVRHLQKRLNKVLLPGSARLPVTGNYGEQTRAAVRMWQLNVDGASGRGADGILGPARQGRCSPLLRTRAAAELL